MAGKQHKREAKRAREAAREAARREERRRTIFTAIVITIVVAIGGVLVAVSVERPDDVASPDESPSPDATEATEIENREVACGAEAPPAAGEDKPTFSESPPEVLEEGVDYQAVIETSCGQIVVDLAEDRAPQTVNSFVFLAQQGFFDGLEIFRNAASIGALQTGAGTDEASFDIGYTLPDELEFAEAEGYPPGSVAMANAGPGTGGSQFFFVYNDQFNLPPQYARFGTVVEGLEVLQQIGSIPTAGPQGETPTQIVYMERVEIREASEPAEQTEPAAEPTPDGDPEGEPTAEDEPTAGAPEATTEPTVEIQPAGSPSPTS